MADEQMMAGEQNEDADLDKILELCQTGNPQALQEIAKIAEGMKANQAQEEQSMGGEEVAPDMAQRVMGRLQQGE
jgi:hypothetical protein